MQTPRFLKDLPVPLRWLWRPWLLTAVGLHAVVLTLPLVPDASKEPELESVTIVELPPEVTAIPPLPLTPAPLPPPSSPVISQPIISPAPAVVPPAAAPVPTPVPVIPTAVQSPLPVESNPLLTPTPTPIPSPTPPPVEEAIPYADFPHALNAQGCDGVENCWQTSDTQWRSIATSLQQSLQDQGYNLQDITEQRLGEITGKRIYEVSREGDSPYYLNLISTLDRGTVYRMTDTPLSLAEMEAIAGLN